MNDFGYIKRNFEELSLELEKIAASVGASVPKLVSVTKSGSDDELIALVSAGARAIGENRPGELKRRGELLFANGLSPELHQIGTLQSNKAKLVHGASALIHSLDSESLAKELNRLGSRDGIEIPVLVEINSASEPQKSGILPEMADEFISSLEKYPMLKVRGLMTMGPVTDADEEIRKYFRLTKRLFDELNKRYSFGEGAVLSMGMSDSYKVAIEEGSTLVRIGRRLFVKN